MKKLIFLLITCSIFFSGIVFSQDIISKGKEVREAFGNFVCNIFCIIWFIIGAVAALIIIWSGAKYMITENALEKEELKGRLKYAVLGLIIVIVAIPAANYLTSGMMAPFNCDCIPREPTTTTTTTTITIITTTTVLVTTTTSSTSTLAPTTTTTISTTTTSLPTTTTTIPGTDPILCENAERENSCNDLNIIWLGYKEDCCDEHGYCC